MTKFERPTHLRERPIAETFSEPATLYRQAEGEFSDEALGWVPGAYAPHEIVVAAEPMSEAWAARVLPEGTRVSGVFKFYVLPDERIDPIRTGDSPAGRDIIRYQDVNYRVHSVMPWNGDHQVVVGIRIDVQDGAPA